MHRSCIIALYNVLLSDVDGYILLLPVGVRHVKKSNLETCSEKPEVDIMMPSIVSEGHFIQ